MKNMKDAYAEWRRHDRMLQEHKRQIAELNRRIDEIAEAQEICAARELATTKAGKRCLRAYTGHTPYGWECACGVDGRFKKLAKTFGWPRWQVVIWIARKMDATHPSNWLPYWHM